jgi:L-threonylcarbamoyladenylate synthase
LLAEAGVPIAGPSANRSGHVSPTTAAHVAADLADRVAMILDGGPTAVGLESTVVDVTGKRRSSCASAACRARPSPR